MMYASGFLSTTLAAEYLIKITTDIERVAKPSLFAAWVGWIEPMVQIS